MTAQRREQQETTHSERWWTMRFALQDLGMTEEDMALVGKVWRTLDQVSGGSRELPTALDGLDEEVKRRLQAYRWYLWARIRCGEDPDVWMPYSRSPELHDRFMNYNPDLPSPPNPTPVILDKRLKNWPLWKDQVPLYLRNFRGVSGLPLSYVVRKERPYTSQETFMSALEGTKTTIEVLEEYGTIPGGPVDEETWWMEDSQRVRNLLRVLVCDKWAPPLLVPADGDELPFRCGRHFFLSFGYRVRHQERRAAKKAAIAEGLRDPSSDESESESESESSDEEDVPPTRKRKATATEDLDVAEEANEAAAEEPRAIKNPEAESA